MNCLKLICCAGLCMLFFGCAAAPDVVYVKEAQQVTTQALEPVMLESADLEGDIRGKFNRFLPPDASENLMKVIQAEIATTKRFTKVLLNSSEGDTYIVQPRIDDIKDSIVKIPTDPTRNLHTVRAKVRLDVLFINQKNQKELVKSFSDDRKMDTKFSVKAPLTADQKQESYQRVLTTAFRAAADQLGNGFNPSYEMGTVSKVNGRTLHIQINTSKILKMPKKQQAVEVVDDDNKVLASVAELVINDGTISGKYYEKGGASIKEGQKVRAKVNGLVD